MSNDGGGHGDDEEERRRRRAAQITGVAVDEDEQIILQHMRTCADDSMPLCWWTLLARTLICIWRDEIVTRPPEQHRGVEAFLFHYGNPYDSDCLTHCYHYLVRKKEPRLDRVARALLLTRLEKQVHALVSDVG